MNTKHQIPSYRNKYALKAARRLGLLTPVELQNPDKRPPRNLCQYIVDDERTIANVAAKPFRRAVAKGGQVFFVTVCRKEWTCGPGELTTTLVREVRDWVCRRARNLTSVGQQRVLGFVEIAWNDRSGVGEPSHWDVHAHFIARIKNAQPNCDHERVFKRAFRCLGDGIFVRKPVVIKRLPTPDDVKRVIDYCSKSLVLKSVKGRWSYVSQDGVRGSRKVTLPTARQHEIDRIVAALGPVPFWILSGLRRRGSLIELHNSSVMAVRTSRDTIRTR